MKISEMDFVRLLPSFMRDDEAVIALSKAMNRLIGEPGKNLHNLRTWDKIDNLSEAECNELAWELDIDWYDSSIGLEEKRETIKYAQQIKQKRGTKWAVERLISAYFGEGYVAEWYEMSGKHNEPYTFVVLTTNADISAENFEKFITAAESAKNARSTLACVYYYWQERPAVGYNLSSSLHRYEHKKCGTTDRAATVGLVVRHSIETEPEITAHKYSHTKAGDHICGTYPRAAVLGISQKATVETGAAIAFTKYNHVKTGTQKCAENNPLRALSLIDRATGTGYALYVAGGKLRMKGHTGAVSDKDAYFTDAETGADFVVYVANGKLRMNNTAGVENVNKGIFDDLETRQVYALYVAGGKLRLKSNM